MYKLVVSQVVAMGKNEEYKALQERFKKVTEKHGVSFKVWRVEGRRAGQMFLEVEEFESRADFEAAIDKLLADKEFQDLGKELAGLVVEGTQEDFLLTDF